MRLTAYAAIAFAIVFAGISFEARADNRLDRIIGGAIGGAIFGGPNRNKGRVVRKSNQRRTGAATARRWASIDPAFGEGTAICNISGETYACFALRCGKGRGTEFAFLFNANNYGDAPTALITTNKGTSHTLQFTAVDANRELVSAFSPSGHADLLRALKAGSTMTFNPGFEHHFSLRGSSKELDRMLAYCTTRQSGGALISQNGEQRRQSGGTVPKGPAETSVLVWRDGDTEEAYVARIRAEAGRFANGDQDRSAAMRAVRNLTVSISKTDMLTGDSAKLNWANNPVDDVSPVYLIVASDVPVRFKGDGFYALMPNAVGPFGFETFAGMTRAIVPLFGKSVSTDGSMDVIPLESGELGLRYAVVTWDRDDSVEIASERSLPNISVKPSSPSLRIDTGELSQEYSEQIDVAGFDRVVELAESRYLIRSRVDGSEVVQRAGRNAVLSPTGRFLVAEADGGYDVVDVVDGEVVANIHGSDIGWFNADSFVVAGGTSYGQTEFVSLADGKFLASHAETSCAACASANATRLGIDLENGFSYVVGTLGYDIRHLASGYTEHDPNLIIADTQFRTQSEAYKKVADHGGKVTTPLTSNGWNTPGGLKFTHFSNARTVDGGDVDSRNSWLASKLVVPRRKPRSESLYGGNETRSGYVEDTVLRSIAPAPRLRSASGTDAETIADRLAQFGLTPAVQQPLNIHFDQTELGQFEESQTQVPDQLLKSMENDIRNAGYQLKWNASKGGMERIYCEHFGDYGENNVFGGLAPDIDFAAKVERPQGAVWVFRATCYGGPTAGTLLWKSYLAVADGAKINPDKDSGQFVVATGGNWGGALQDCNQAFYECDLKLRAFNDKLVFFSRKTRSIAVFDLSTRKFIFEKSGVSQGDLMVSVALLGDLRHVLQLNSDGGFFVYRLADHQQVLEGRYIDDEIVVWSIDPERGKEDGSGVPVSGRMRFDSTAEGAHFVNLRFPGQPGQYTFQQFDARLRVEGLAQKVLAGTYEPQPLEVGVPPRLSGSLSVAADRIGGTVTPESLGDLRGIRIYQDGVLTNELLALESGEPVEIDVQRLPGARWVSAVALDEEGLVSLPVGRDLGPDLALSKVRLLAVGVDQYDDDSVPDLGLAVSDANTLKTSLEKVSGQSIDLDSPVVLANSDATPEVILAAAEELVRLSRPGEQAVFFFAGHGVKGEDGRFYMATSATDPSNISGTALSWDELSAVLSRSKARMTVFLDACHSGAAGTDFFATNDDAASGILKNIPSGLTVFSASKGRELSEEDPAIKGGQFTTAVSRVIAAQRGEYDLNGNGMIEVSELYVGVKQQVVQRTKGRQTPWLARNQMVGDFALF